MRNASSPITTPPPTTMASAAVSASPVDVAGSVRICHQVRGAFDSIADSTASAATVVAPRAGASLSNARAMRVPPARARRRRSRKGIGGKRAVTAAVRRFSRTQFGKPSAMNVLRAASQAPPATSTSSPHRGSGLTHQQDEPSPLVAPPGSEAERLGDRYARRSPVLLFCLTLVAGYLLLAAAMVGLGFLLVDVVLPVHAIGHNDEAVNVWLASHRSPGLSDASYVGSMIGDIPFIPALVIVTALGAALLRRWRLFAFIVGAILV